MQIVGRFEDAGFPQLAEISLQIVQTICLDVDRRSSRSVAYTTKVEVEMARPHPVGTLLAPSFAISQSPVGPYRLVVLRSAGLIEFDELLVVQHTSSSGAKHSVHDDRICQGRVGRRRESGKAPDDTEVLMMMFLTGLLLTAVIVFALYAFGVFSTPYLDAVRVAFYLLLVLLVLSIWVSVGHQPHQGQDTTVGAAKQ